MDAKTAAIQVLKQAEAPLHYKSITEKALEKGWRVIGGKTPEVTKSMSEAPCLAFAAKSARKIFGLG